MYIVLMLSPLGKRRYIYLIGSSFFPMGSWFHTMHFSLGVQYKGLTPEDISVVLDSIFDQWQKSDYVLPLR